MSQLDLGAYQLTRVMPATLEAAEDVFSDFRMGVRDLLEASCYFTLELMLREALTNAVVHGCHAKPDKTVRCWLRIKRGAFLLLVQDEGTGFDWRAAYDTPALFPDCSGRGIQILRKNADRVRYNATGNSVAIVKHFLIRKHT